jgi:hypothetical protein
MIPGGTGIGALGFSLNLAAASAVGTANSDGGTGSTTGNFPSEGFVPIGGSESDGGSSGIAATAAGRAAISSDSVAGCASSGSTERRGFNRTRGSGEAIRSGLSPAAAAGLAGRGAGDDGGGLPEPAAVPLPVDSVAGATGAAAGIAAAGSFPTRNRGFKRKGGGWDSSLMP